MSARVSRLPSPLHQRTSAVLGRRFLRQLSCISQICRVYRDTFAANLLIAQKRPSVGKKLHSADCFFFDLA